MYRATQLTSLFFAFVGKFKIYFHFQSNSYCSTESILTLITNAVSECSYKFELDGGYPEECYEHKRDTKWGSLTTKSFKPTNTFLSHGANCYSSNGPQTHVDTYFNED